jgi:hypothetical protein
VPVSRKTLTEVPDTAVGDRHELERELEPAGQPGAGRALRPVSSRTTESKPCEHSARTPLAGASRSPSPKLTVAPRSSSSCTAMPVFSSRRSTATYGLERTFTRSTPVTVARRRTPMLVPVSVIASPTPAERGFGGWWYSASTSE